MTTEKQPESLAPERAPGWWIGAVAPEGRRTPHAPLVDAVLCERARAAGATLVLDHAGPCAASWSASRPVAAAEVATPIEGRTPRALDDAGWRAVFDAFAGAADACRAGGGAWALALDDDGLLHDALRYAPDRAHAILMRVAAPIVLVPVEDLAPGGLDATDGIAIARLAAEHGARTIVASAGARSFAPLRFRAKGATTNAALASSAWLLGRLPSSVAVVALVPAGTPPASAAGLAAVLVEGAR